MLVDLQMEKSVTQRWIWQLQYALGQTSVGNMRLISLRLHCFSRWCIHCSVISATEIAERKYQEPLGNFG